LFAADQEPRRDHNRAVRLLIASEAVVVVLLTLAILGLATIQITARYILHISIPWTEELAQLTLLWLVFIGAGLVSAQDSHVTIRILGKLLRPRGRRLLAGFAYVVIIASVAILIWVGWEPMVARMRLPLPATRWPAGLHYVGVIVGLTLILVHTSINLWSLLRGRYLEAAEDVEPTML
jgi:TRAP-type C4-dicarboxylate transport system permease small subunit